MLLVIDRPFASLSASRVPWPLQLPWSSLPWYQEYLPMLLWGSRAVGGGGIWRVSFSDHLTNSLNKPAAEVTWEDLRRFQDHILSNACLRIHLDPRILRLSLIRWRSRVIVDTSRSIQGLLYSFQIGESIGIVTTYALPMCARDSSQEFGLLSSLGKSYKPSRLCGGGRDRLPITATGEGRQPDKVCSTCEDSSAYGAKRIFSSSPRRGPWDRPPPIVRRCPSI